MPQALAKILDSGTETHGYESVHAPGYTLLIETATEAEAAAEGWTLYDELPHQALGAPAWVQPVPGDPDAPAYDLGAWTHHNGKMWQSLVADNVWEPGVSSWREHLPQGGPPPWLPPTGATDAYQQGDRVTHAGTTWVSEIDDNVWEPGVQGNEGLWADENATQTDQWQAGTAYSAGDVVTYEGTEYECLQAHTSQVGWEPDVTPALWTSL